MYVYVCIYVQAHNWLYDVIEGSVEVKLPTIWTEGKQRWEESEKRRAEERRSEKRKNEKKEDAGAQKVAVRERQQSRGRLCFPMFAAQQGWKVGSLKRRVRSHVVRWEINQKWKPRPRVAPQDKIKRRIVNFRRTHRHVSRLRKNAKVPQNPWDVLAVRRWLIYLPPAFMFAFQEGR